MTDIILVGAGGCIRELALQILESNKLHNEWNILGYVAYNRRFYASAEKALEIILKDGGLRDMHFEFTEWGERVRPSVENKSEEIRESWFLANSTHVVDLAWFLVENRKKCVAT